MKNLGKEIRKRRLKLGLTQKKVEELLGVGVGSYQRIECGRTGQDVPLHCRKKFLCFRGVRGAWFEPV